MGQRIFSKVFLSVFLFGYGYILHAQKHASDKLKAILATVEGFNLYDNNEYPLGRFQEELEKKESNFAQAQLQLLKELNSSTLSETEQISAELMRFRLQNVVDEYTYKMYLNPILADEGFHLNLNYRIQPIVSLNGAEHYLKVLNAIPTFVDEHLVLLRKGLKKGLSQPQIIFQGYESTYNLHIVADYTQSAFYKPFYSLPLTMTPKEKEKVLAAAKQAIEHSVVPAFKKIKQFFETEYIPNTRTTLAVSALENGKDFYQNRINYYTTTTQYTADAIHNLGLKEVARIRVQMKDIMLRVGFKGSFEDFLTFLRTDNQFYAPTGEALLMHARDIAKRIDAVLPKVFKTLPRRPYGVIKVPDAIAPKYTGGRYSGPTSETEPGYYLVNTYKLQSRPLYTLPSLTAHEAVPGHHLQGSLNKELGDSIPHFRKNMYLSAYGEGWALYSEYLGNELGIYTTPYEEFGKLTYEMWRACRLVVDTGIHAKGWSREKVMQYMLANTALSKHEIGTETDRYIAWPGQAISYKIGELKIRELRKKAESQLGGAFDIREFHEIILEQGTVTLPILEKRINNYIAKSK